MRPDQTAVIVVPGRRVRFRHRRPVDRGVVAALVGLSAVYVGALVLGMTAVADVIEAFR